MDNCQGSLLPWNYLKCPHCKYEHEWPEDKKTAQRLQFACNVYAEEGKGCDKVIGLGKGWKKAGKAGPHPDPLCEKCVQLGYKCTSHGKGKKKKPPTGSVNPCALASSVGASSDASSNSHEEAPSGSRKKMKNKRSVVSAVAPTAVATADAYREKNKNKRSVASAISPSNGPPGHARRNGDAEAPPVGASVNGDVNNNEVSPALETKKRNLRRPRRKSSVKQDADVVNELCQILEKL